MLISTSWEMKGDRILKKTFGTKIFHNIFLRKVWTLDEDCIDRFWVALAKRGGGGDHWMGYQISLMICFSYYCAWDYIIEHTFMK